MTKAPDDPTATLKAVATFAPKPVMPVETGNPVALVSVPLEGVPKTPPLVTKAPDDPTATPKAVATFAPKPEIPVETGNPVTLVSVPLEGVPNDPLNKTGAPALFTATPNAENTPEPYENCPNWVLEFTYNPYPAVPPVIADPIEMVAALGATAPSTPALL